MTIDKLINHEVEYINLWGDLYSNRGQNEVLGKIWGLLTLRADTQEKGLDQVQISNFLHCSLSTVSRHLKTLISMQIISYLDGDVRKYYTSKNFKELSNLRFHASVKEYQDAVDELDEIKSAMTEKEKKSNKNLLQTIELTENVLKEISEIFLNVLMAK